MNGMKEQVSDTWPTIFELASTIKQVDLTTSRVRGSKSAPSVTLGLTPEPFPATEGYFQVSPEQIASLRVPKIEVGSSIVGFQREKVNSHVRKIARAMLDGQEMPPLIVSIFPDGQAYANDGQHRALAAVVARLPLDVVVKRRSIADARKLFASQQKAKAVRSDDTLLTGNSDLEIYIQDALTAVSHPWSHLVAVKQSRTRISPTTMAAIVGSFVYNSLTANVTDFVRRREGDFDENLAHRMAHLLDAFGSKSTNPMAFKGGTLRGVSQAAVYVFRRNPELQEGDWERWQRHMASFDFARFPHLFTKESAMAIELVNHWNKRLSEDRKVMPYNITDIPS